MAVSLQLTKRRISSINSTKKITNAMYLVSSSKFKVFKYKMDQSSVYKDELIFTMNQLYCSLDEDSKASLFKENKSNTTLYIVVGSSLGLCGGYNQNIYKYLNSNVDKEDVIMLPIGTKPLAYLKRKGYEIDDTFVDGLLGFDHIVSKNIATYVFSQLELGLVNKVKIIYTKFINSIRFEPVTEDIYPLDPTKFNKELSFKELNTLIEPSPKSVLKNIIPLYLETLIYQDLLEAQVSEHSSRRNAMDSATDNAQEIINRLQIEYNKVRQANITQEITEIVSGANAQE